MGGSIPPGMGQAQGDDSCQAHREMENIFMAKSKEVVRLGAGRPALERIQRIHEAIGEGRYPNCRVLAEELEVTQKTIQRDITFMQDRLGLPVKYDKQLFGYHYTADVSSFPVFEVGAGELAALFLARQAIDSVRGTRLEKTMREIFAKLTRSIEGRVQFQWDDLDRALSRKPAAATKIDLKLFGRLAEAVVKSREVEFGYRKLGGERTEQRHLQPYHLGEIDHCWYVIGWDLERGALRTFALQRIQGLKVTRRIFEVQDDFDGAAYLGSSFGVWTDPERPGFKQEVRIELSGYGARLAQERRWHPSQQVKPLNAKSTRVEVRFEVGRLEELVRWTLSWGGLAKVRAPEELKKRVVAEAALIQANA